MTSEQTLIVDGANVVGSRPDGWWRDRAGAAARLQQRLLRAELDTDEIVLVLEGRARSGVAEGVVDRVRSVHATADGDSAMVELAEELIGAGRRVVVVTADRGLTARIEAVGGRVLRPSWLLERLDRLDAPG